jgi:hypothetical protein
MTSLNEMLFVQDPMLGSSLIDFTNKFSCSTPINNKDDKCDFNAQNENNENREEDETEETNSLNSEEIHASLAEFEENEKRVENSSTLSMLSNSTKSLFKSPIQKMESLVGDLRSCFELKPVSMFVMPLDDEETARRSRRSGDDERSAMLAELNGGGGSSGAVVGVEELLEHRLESEIVRRLFCEKQVEELNKTVCELRQHLAVANESDKKRIAFAGRMDASLRKVNG